MTGHGPRDDPQRVVADHLVCVSCNYDLHGLAVTCNCPECGYPVSLSVDAGGHPSGWLIAIHSGIQALLVGHYILLGSAALTCMLPIGVAFFVIMMLGAAVEIGLPHPELADDDHLRKIPARLIGGSMVVCILGALLSSTSTTAAVLVGAAGTMGLITSLAILWMLISRIMRRSLSLRAAQLGSVLAMIVGACGVLVLLAIIPVTSGLTRTLDSQWSQVLLIIAGALWLIQSLAAVYALHIALRALKKALEIAREREAAEPIGALEPASTSDR